MYNFNLVDGEEIIKVFDDDYVKQGENEKNTTIAVTNKRILFMDYDKEDPNENLRIGRGIDYVRYKEVYYQVNIEDIRKIVEGELYMVILNTGIEFELDNEELVCILKENIK